jgi:hypothetical protein
MEMFAIATVMALLGYGAGFEGYDNGKVYLGFYTPTHEYGWVVTNDEIYLDTVMDKGYGR